MLSPPSSGNSIEGEIQTLLNLKIKFAGFNLLVFIPHVSGPEGSQRLSYEAVKLTNNGGGNPIVSRPCTSEEQKGWAIANGIDGEGDEWRKVLHSVSQSLREILKDDFERVDDSNSRRQKSDEELG